MSREGLGEPCHWFAEGPMYVAVRLGEPNQDAQIGIGLTPREAVDSLESVPVQSGGREPVARALRRADGAGWILMSRLFTEADRLAAERRNGGRYVITGDRRMLVPYTHRANGRVCAVHILPAGAAHRGLIEWRISRTEDGSLVLRGSEIFWDARSFFRVARRLLRTLRSDGFRR